MELKEGEPGHFVEVNGHNVFGYSRYIDFYNTIVSHSEDDQIFVEIGSFLGQSTAAMGYYIINSKKRIDFYAVDLFEISDFSDEPHTNIINQHGGDFYKAFETNIEKAKVDSAVKPLKMSSIEAASKFADRSVSFVMIDASHKYEDVVDDIKAWFPKLKLGGIISGDDYDWEEVAKAAKDTLGTLGLANNSTWFCKKQAVSLEEQKNLK